MIEDQRMIRTIHKSQSSTRRMLYCLHSQRRLTFLWIKQFFLLVVCPNSFGRCGCWQHSVWISWRLWASHVYYSLECRQSDATITSKTGEEWRAATATSIDVLVDGVGLFACARQARLTATNPMVHTQIAHQTCDAMQTYRATPSAGVQEGFAQYNLSLAYTPLCVDRKQCAVDKRKEHSSFTHGLTHCSIFS